MKKLLFSIAFIICISSKSYCALSQIPDELDYKLVQASLVHNIDTNLLRALCFNETTYGRSSQGFNWKEYDKCNIEHMNQLAEFGYPIINEHGLFLHSVDIGPLQICSINYQYVKDLCSFEEFFHNVDMQIEASCRYINNAYAGDIGIFGKTKEDIDVRVIAAQYRYGHVTGRQKYREGRETGIYDPYTSKFYGEYIRLKKEYNE